MLKYAVWNYANIRSKPLNNDEEPFFVNSQKKTQTKTKMCTKKLFFMSKLTFDWISIVVTLKIKIISKIAVLLTCDIFAISDALNILNFII